MAALRDDERDTWLSASVRALQHPMRAFAMAAAAFCFVSGIALTTGIVAAILGAMAGVVMGELLARTPLRLASMLGGLAIVTGIAFGVAAAIVRVEPFALIVGTGNALRMVGLLHYGSMAFGGAASLRCIAKRHPSFVALELGVIVLAVAVALAAHRGGVVARPLWLSDFAWRRGLDPADVLLGIGVSAGLVAVSLLLFERKGRLSFASLPLVPIVAIVAASCLQVGRAQDERAEPSPDPETAHSVPTGGSQSDASTPPRDGGGSRDAGARDASSDGGGGSGGDGGDGGGAPSSGWDAGQGGTVPPPRSTGQGQSSGPVQVHPNDLFDQPPPTGPRAASPVAVVLFESDYSPPSESYYFRQETWSQFEGPRLVPATLPEADRDLAEHFPVGHYAIPEPPPETGRTLVGGTVALLVTHPNPFALESPVSLEEARNPNPSRFRRAYRFLSLAQSIPFAGLLGRRAGNPAWSDALRDLYLAQHPDPRFRAWADETIAGMPETRRSDPFARAVAIKLRMDALLTYSTSERHADAEDPVADFFFGNHIGYCVHFAHAAVYLFRAAGVPARIGVGYMSMEANRHGGSALVLQGGDAHAWPEIYLEGIGWIVLDISAHENLDTPRPPQDDELQQMLGEMAREQPPDPAQEVRPARAPQPNLGRAFGILFVAALVLVLGVLYTIKIWRRLAPTFASRASLPRVAHRAALDRLAEVGMVREHGETREQFARRAASIAPSFDRVTSMLLASKLGREEHDPARWSEATRATRTEIARSTKWWRRLLGLLHPVSFLDAR